MVVIQNRVWEEGYKPSAWESCPSDRDVVVVRPDLALGAPKESRVNVANDLPPMLSGLLPVSYNTINRCRSMHDRTKRCVRVLAFSRLILL